MKLHKSLCKIYLDSKVLLSSPEKVAHLSNKENQALFDILWDMSETRLTGLVLCGLTQTGGTYMYYL